MAKRSSSKKKHPGRLAYIVRLIKKTAVIFFASTILVTLIFRFVNPPVTWLMVQRAVERKFAGKEWKIEKDWKDMDEISLNLQRAGQYRDKQGCLVFT